MKKTRLISFFLLALGLQLSGASLCVAESLQGPNQVVIAHSTVANESLSLNQLRAIFSLRARAWPDGDKITVVVLKDEAPVHREFLLKTLKMLPHQLRRQWDRYIYSGIGQGPVVVETRVDMLNIVNQTPGAIGYIEGDVPDGQVITLTIH